MLLFEELALSTSEPEETHLETAVPFRAWRYAPSVGDPALLVAPPYDIIGPELQSRLYARSPYNVVRVDLGMTTPSDSDCDNQYTRAAAQLAEWKRSGVLVRDPQPSLTFVQETFTGPDGRASVRHGFLAAMRLHDFDEGVVFPHEWTLSGPKEDRYRLMTATEMSLSPVFLLYDLPGDEITAAWKATLGAETPATTVADEEGTVTKLWPTSDPDLLKTVGQNLAASRFVIADGHHRYETALRYQKQRASRASDYALAYFSNMADPGLAIYGTHRLVSGLDPDRVAALPRSLAGTFAVERLTASAGRHAADSATDAVSAAQTAISAYLAAHPRGAFGLWGPGLDAAYGLRLVDQAAAREAGPDHSAAYQELDVTIMQSLVLEKVLGISPADMAAERNVTYFKDPNEAFARLAAGDFQAGFFMNPTGLDQIREVALGGERMPQKATFFYPKLPTGLVFHDLSE
jgi:uncharacterized protein (DUF1015 family)